MINAQTPGGFAELSGGRKGILLFNKNGNDFVAFDKFCPSNDCTSAMTFSNRLLKCTCDESKYSVDFVELHKLKVLNVQQSNTELQKMDLQLESVIFSIPKNRCLFLLERNNIKREKIFFF